MDTAGQVGAVAGATQGGENEQPNEVLKVQQLLRSMGVEDWEPRVVNMLVDFVYKYTTDVVLDAEVRALQFLSQNGDRLSSKCWICWQSPLLKNNCARE